MLWFIVVAMDYTFLLIFLGSLAFPALIAFIIILIVKKSVPNHSNNKPNHSMVRETITGLVLFSAAISGLMSLTYLPDKVLMISSESVNFGIRVALGVALIIIGALLKNKLQKNFLLVLGLLMILLQMPYIFNTFGSYGALVVAAAAFVTLVRGTVILTKRHQH